MANLLPALSRKKIIITAFLLMLKLCLTLTFFSLTSGKAMAFSESQFQVAFLQFSSASGAEERAAESFTALLKKEPSNSLLMAYLGAATSRLAAVASWPWKKMSYAEEGMAMLDKALQLAAVAETEMHGTIPVAIEVKFVAANTFLAVPGFMNRGPRGAKLLSEVIEHKQFNQTALGFRGAVWIRAARLALEQKRNEDAKRYLNAVIQSGAPQVEAAKGLLKGVV